MCKSLMHSSLYGALRCAWIMSRKYRLSTESDGLFRLFSSLILVLVCAVASLDSTSAFSSIQAALLKQRSTFLYDYIFCNSNKNDIYTHAFPSHRAIPPLPLFPASRFSDNSHDNSNIIYFSTSQATPFPVSIPPRLDLKRSNLVPLEHDQPREIQSSLTQTTRQ